MTIAADIGRATIAGFVARNASARAKVDGSGVQIDRLAVADLGGGSFSASGRIDTSGHSPRGSLTLDFESRQAAAIAALVKKFAPKTATPVAGLLERINHAKLHATLDVADDKQASVTTAQVAVTGAVDAMNVDVRARMSGDWEKPAAADIRLDGTVDAPDGAALLGLSASIAIWRRAKAPANSNCWWRGPARSRSEIDLRLSAGGLAAQVGHGRLSLDKGLQLTSSLQVAKADLRPLRPAGMADSGEPLPFSLNSRVAIADRAIKL